MKQEFKNWLIQRGNPGAAKSYPGAINQLSIHYSENTHEKIDIYSLRDIIHSALIYCAQSAQDVIRLTPYIELMKNDFSNILKHGKVPIVGAEFSCKLPYSFDIVQIWAIGRKIIETENVLMLCQPRG